VVMLNVWATWCPPCQHEMPVLEAYYQAHKHTDFVIVGVNWEDNQKEIESFIEEYSLSFLFWMDTDLDARRVLNKPPMPCSYIIDRGGNLRLRWIGEVDLEALETYVTPLLEE
jgi:cytochrome c biogenesis protein CcmG/thiol:disulfide interchange protein DsbE